LEDASKESEFYKDIKINVSKGREGKKKKAGGMRVII